MKKHRVIIAGSRDFNNYELLRTKCGYYTFCLEPGDIEVVSGGCRGADKLGERWAAENNIPVKIFEADWKKHGDIAGKLRNQEMANYGTHCIAFWDGKSTGTRHMIGRAKEAGLKIRVVNY